MAEERKIYVVIDLEFCKVHKKMRANYKHSHEIIEIGAVALDENFEEIGRYVRYVAPEFGALDAFITDLTGIVEKDLEGAMHFKEAMEDFFAWIPEGDVTMISWSTSDLYQIIHEMRLKNVELPQMTRFKESWVDSQKMFTKKINSNRSYGLAEALLAADIYPEGEEHDALYDAVNTAMLFARMNREEELILNPLYLNMNEEVESHLSFSLGDLMAGLDLSGATK